MSFSKLSHFHSRQNAAGLEMRDGGKICNAGFEITDIEGRQSHTAPRATPINDVLVFRQGFLAEIAYGSLQ